MDLNYGPEAEAFRSEVRQFLLENWHPGKLRGAELKAAITKFRLEATDQGYLYRSIPRQYGGSEQPIDVVRAQIIREEFGAARAPMEVVGNGMSMLVPTLLEWGTLEQKDMFLKPTVMGEFLWGQGYSEPGTGSDLASVRTKAVLDGDEWVINGQKIWTSQGKIATHMFALARTVGWATHWCEMMANPSLRIGRPRQLYLGPKQRNYIPLDQR